MLGEPPNAASELRAVLPAEVVTRLELDQLRRVDGSFVDPELRWRHSDLLFTVPLQGRDAFVYVLVEHQSRTDPLMPFRMLRYVVRIWDRYLAEHPQAARLPAVVPLVVHHNRRPWSGPTDVLDLVDLEPDTVKVVEECLPRLRFLLDDLTVVDEQALRTRPLNPPARVMLLLLKIAADSPHLVADLGSWTDELRAAANLPGGEAVFQALVTYIQQFVRLEA